MIRNYLLLAFDFKDNFFSKKFLITETQLRLKFSRSKMKKFLNGHPFINNSINIENYKKSQREKIFKRIY